jgi:hypothetical protein
MQIKLNLNLIDKSKITEENYTRKDGVVVNNKVILLDIRDLKEEKIVATSKDGSKELVKTGFITHPSIKNLDGSYTNGTIIGDAQEWRFINQDTVSACGEDISTGGVDPSDLPF